MGSIIALSATAALLFAFLSWNRQDRHELATVPTVSVATTEEDPISTVTTAPVLETSAPTVPTPASVAMLDTTRALFRPEEVFPLSFPLGVQAGAITIVPGTGIVTSLPDENYGSFEMFRIGADRVPEPIGVRHGNLWQVLGGPDGRLYLRDGATLAVYRFQNGQAVMAGTPIALGDPSCMLAMTSTSVSCGDASIQFAPTVQGGDPSVIEVSYEVPPDLPHLTKGSPSCGTPDVTPGRCVTFGPQSESPVHVVPVASDDGSRSSIGVLVATQDSAGTHVVFIRGGPVIGIDNGRLFVWSVTQDACDVYELATLMQR